jgi:phosphoribosylaminoimidazolecarboxamide formyltransferase/IMP cyclohydrolase
MQPVTTLVPNASELEDLVFANKLVKHTKSNTIVLAKDKQLLGQRLRYDIAGGCTSSLQSPKPMPLDSTCRDAVMASDAFFPFPDCVEIAGNEGIRAVVQPGGSIRDKDSMDYCNAHSMAMVVTGVQPFQALNF